MDGIVAATTGARGRVAAYILTAISLLILFYASRGSTWQGSKELHTTMEVAATLLALIVGGMALVRHYSKRIIFLSS